MTVSYRWRGDFTSAVANALHAECFGHPVLGDDDWDWRGQVERHSLGWVCAHDGTGMVEIAVREARAAGCDWLHVDFEDHLRAFYFDACGFVPTNAGLIEL
jgi:hypothetical protein